MEADRMDPLHAELHGVGQSAIAGLPLLQAFAEVEEVLRSKAFEHSALEAPGSLRYRSLVDVDGDEHFQRRLLYGRLFDRTAHRRYDDEILAPTTRAMLARLPKGIGGSRRADLIDLVRILLLRVACVVTGLDGVEDKDLGRLDGYVAIMQEANHVRWSRRDHDEVMREANEAKERYIQEFFEQSWARRQGLAERARSEQPGPELPNDLLMTIAMHPEVFPPNDAALCLAEGLLFTTGTTSTIPTLLPHAVAELEGWIERHPEDRARLTDIGFLRAAAIESLRLHQTGMPLRRRARQDVTLASGRRIEAGQRILVDTSAAARDPEVYGEDANEFRPTRTLPRKSPHGFVFGGGPHLCIGRGVSIGDEESDGGDTPGIMVRLLREFYAAGITTDPADPPRLLEPVVSGGAVVVRHYSAFPVVFGADAPRA